MLLKILVEELAWYAYQEFFLLSIKGLESHWREPSLILLLVDVASENLLATQPHVLRSIYHFV